MNMSLKKKVSRDEPEEIRVSWGEPGKMRVSSGELGKILVSWGEPGEIKSPLLKVGTGEFLRNKTTYSVPHGTLYQYKPARISLVLITLFN